MCSGKYGSVTLDSIRHVLRHVDAGLNNGRMTESSVKAVAARQRPQQGPGTMLGHLQTYFSEGPKTGHRATPSQMT